MIRISSLVQLLRGAAFGPVIGLAAIASAGTLDGTVVSEHGFESAEGVSTWPGGTRVLLDEEEPKAGKASISFDQDSNYVAYFYLEVKPGRRYDVSLACRAVGKPLDRNGVKVKFNKAGGGNGSAGSASMSFADVKADGAWHDFAGSFVTPADAVKVQFILDFYRTGSKVSIDELVIREIGPSDADEDAPTESAPAEAKAPGFRNGNFSEGLEGWSAWFKPDEAKHELDEAHKKIGDASVKISGPDKRHFLAQKVAVEPGAVYKITYWAKTADDSAGTSAVAMDFFPTNASPRPYSPMKVMKGTQDWRQFTFFAEAPADAKGAYLCLIHSSGTIWFDDIRMEEDG